MRIKNDDLTLSSTDLDEASITSSAVNVEHISQFAVQVVTSGTHTGTLKVQASCDEKAPTNWSDIPDATEAVSDGAAYLINVVDAGYNWVRVVYTKSAFTDGTITSARINLKGV